MFEGFDGWLRAKGEEAEKPYTVSEFLEHTNLVLSRQFEDVVIEGEVTSFKVNQKKWVFFDLRDEESSINCFMVISRLTIALRDGMKVRILATPKVTQWGKFSLTVQKIMPVGEGSIKKSFEILKRKLQQEGLFAEEKKRPLPERISRIGVISSVGAAGYRDFLKIIDNRWGGMAIKVVNTQVQGIMAANQIIRALEFLNEGLDLEVIVIVRGGGSADDLAVFNDEELVRAIARSRIPVVTGIGHEVDETLSDLAADLRASTPSNAAERLTRDRAALRDLTQSNLANVGRLIVARIEQAEQKLGQQMFRVQREILQRVDHQIKSVREKQKLLFSLNPELALRRGYAIIKRESTRKGNFEVGEEISILTQNQKLLAEVKHAQIKQ